MDYTTSPSSVRSPMQESPIVLLPPYVNETLIWINYETIFIRMVTSQSRDNYQPMRGRKYRCQWSRDDDKTVIM